jgi:hypothetical protein
MAPYPQTPAEQAAVIEDATDKLIGEGAHDRAVLADMYAELGKKIPELDRRIDNCVGCNRSYMGCAACKADRLELAALLGY